VLLAGAPAFAAPRTEMDTVGREETKAVVEAGTPGAAKLGKLAGTCRTTRLLRLSHLAAATATAHPRCRTTENVWFGSDNFPSGRLAIAQLMLRLAIF
jgi:hypothetical protein